MLLGIKIQLILFFFLAITITTAILYNYWIFGMTLILGIFTLQGIYSYRKEWKEMLNNRRTD